MDHWKKLIDKLWNTIGIIASQSLGVKRNETTINRLIGNEIIEVTPFEKYISE